MPSYKDSEKASKLLYGACAELMRDEPFFAKLKDTLKSGKVKISSLRKEVRKNIESEWMDAIELCLVSLDNVIRSPGRYLEQIEEIKPIELSHNITSKSIRDLAQHVEYISGIEEGNVIPSKILNCYNEETLMTYENKFVNTLIRQLYFFVDKRYSEILKKGSESGTDFDVSAEFQDGDLSAEITFGVHVKSSYSSGDEKAGEQIDRLKKLYEIVQAYQGSAFVKAMGNAFVRPPIMRTNALLKNRDLRACLELWGYLQSYEKVGYSISVEQESEMPDEALMDRLYANLAMQYAVYRREIARAKETLEQEDVVVSLPIFRRELKAVEQKKFVLPDCEYVRVTPVKYLSPPGDTTKDEKAIRAAIDRALKADAILKKLEIREAEKRRKEDEKKRKELEALLSVRETISDAEAPPVEVPVFKTVPDTVVINVTQADDSAMRVATTELIDETGEYEIRSVDEDGMAQVVRYNKSFTAKLIQSQDETKDYYSKLKNDVMSYKNVTSRVSWHFDSVNKGRTQLVKFAIRGKTLCMYLALDPEKFADSKYKVEKAESKKYEDVPLLYRIRSDRRLRYGHELIEMLAAEFGLERGETQSVDYVLPYEDTKTLVDKGLVKVVTTKENYEEFLARHGWEKYKEDKKQLAESLLAGDVDVSNVGEKAPVQDEAGDVEISNVSGGFADITRLRKSFTAKLIQAPDETKQQYSDLKNRILSYETTASRVSWNCDTVHSGKKQLVKFAIKGKSLYVYLALDPGEFASTKYKAKTAKSKKFEDVPCLMKITSARKLAYTLEMIDFMCEKLGLALGEVKNDDYVPPFEPNKPLIERGLIKTTTTREAYAGGTPGAEDVAGAEEEETAETETDKSGNLIVSRYRRSFMAKVIQAPDETKRQYSDLKNRILSYDNTSSRVSWSCDTVHSGRKQLVKFAVKGKSLYVYLALDPKEYAATKYKTKHAGSKKFEEVPCLIKITSSRKFGYAGLLIDAAAERNGLAPGEAKNENYAPAYENDEELLRKGLIKENKGVIGKGAISVRGGALDEDNDEDLVTDAAQGEESGGIAKTEFRYRKSFYAKLAQGTDECKGYYSDIKNKLLSYKKISDRQSWGYEQFSTGRTKIARLLVKGKTLVLCLAMDPGEFENTKYNVKRSSSGGLAAFPSTFKVKSERSRKYALEMIEMLAEKIQLTPEPKPEEDFRPPFVSTEELIASGHVKESTGHIASPAASVESRDNAEIRAEQPGDFYDGRVDFYGRESGDESGFAPSAQVLPEPAGPAEDLPPMDVGDVGRTEDADEKTAEEGRKEAKKGFFGRLFDRFRGKKD